MKIGRTIRKLRLAKNIKLQQFAEMTNMSISGLSQLERDLSNPSLATLVKIARALRVPIMSLFLNSQENTEHKAAIIRDRERRKIIVPDLETIYEPLSPVKNARVEFVLARMEEGKTQKVLVTHEGEEHIYVIKGTLQVRIENDAYVLKEGDSIWFNSLLGHAFKNAGKGQMIAIIAASPPSLYERVLWPGKGPISEQGKEYV